ncbi:MAG: amidohydrolase family protein [Phycisphaerae bacterium]|nr:amidohydrolase family protein [Phycisphaerae bacterium]
MTRPRLSMRVCHAGVMALMMMAAVSPLFGQTERVPAADSKSAPASEPADTVVLKVGKLYEKPTKPLIDSILVVRDGEVVDFGRDIDVPAGARVIELPNAVITAGLIDACISAAAFQNYKGPENETECTPQLRVLDSIDLRDESLRQLAESGVTAIHVTAEPVAVIGPRGATLRTSGPIGARTIKPADALKVTIGREPMYRRGWNRGPWGDVSFMTRRPTTRMGLIWTLRKSFHDASAAIRGESPGTHGDSSPSENALPLLERALKGEIPIRIQARQQLDILAALRVAKEFGFDFVLEEGTDAARCAAELKAAGVPVIYGPIFDYPTGFRAGSGEVNRARYSTPAELVRSGITLALTASDLSGEASLAMQASYAMRFGLTREQALAAVTTTPAKLLGIEDVAGEIGRNRPADLVVWSGEPFELTSRPVMVIVGGEIVLDRTAE